VPGIGPIISSAMVAAIGSGAAFARGRDYSAWLGLVPKQMSTGDRTILGRISKRGNGLLAHALHTSSPGYSVAAGETGRSMASEPGLIRAAQRLASERFWPRPLLNKLARHRLDRAGTGAQL